MSDKEPLPPIPENFPKKGEYWRHQESGARYLVITRSFNVELQRWEIVYAPTVTTGGNNGPFHRACEGPKNWFGLNKNGVPRFHRDPPDRNL